MPVNAKNIVRQTLDPQQPRPLTPQQKQRIAAVAARPDSVIDYSDAPFLPDAAWVKAGHIPPAKRQITLRIDADILDYFRNGGKRYQTRMNAVLRAYVQGKP